MKRITDPILFSLFFFFTWINLLHAQNLKQDFEGYNIGDSLSTIGWSASDIQAKIAADPVTSGNKVLKNTVHNYNAAPVIKFVLPAGKTLADYKSFSFKGYFAQGDVGYKSIVVEAYQTKPTAQFGNNANAKIGTWARNQMGSTGWENITVDITNSSGFKDTVYLAFGINCAGTGNVGGTGVTTIWYADSITLVAKPAVVTDTTLVSQWGIASYHGSGFHLKVSTAGDSANLYGTNLSGWESVRGAFSSPIVGNTGANGAIVVSGKITFVGEGPDTWSALRYGVYNNLVPGTLQYAGTDSVIWAGMGNNSYGYSFMPQSGVTYVGNIPSGFNASQGIALNGSWLSSYAGVGFGGLIQQAPARAVMDAGTYDFAFSFHQLSDGTKRVNFYLIKEGTPTTYWYGGSYILQDTASMMRTDTLNAVCFGVEKLPNMTSMIVSNVHVSLGADITVPVAPFQAFYVDQWGSFGGRTGGWHFVVDPDTLIGNAGVAGSKVPTGSWATIRGGFTYPVTATLSKALIVTGSITFTGSGPITWSGLRYGLFRNDSAGTVKYALTDSSQWTGKDGFSYGYMFTPHSGTNDQTSWGVGGVSTQGVCNGGTWLSTYGATFPLGQPVDQAPARANFDAGTYDFMISVQPQADGSNQVSAYMVKEGNPVTYWYGGTFKDTSHVSATFNGIVFGLDPNYDQTNSPISAMTLTNVKVDLGTPPPIPPAPFQAFYVDQWGMVGNRTGGWHFVVDPDTLIGNAGIAGSKVPTGNWATIRGGFSVPVTATQSKAIIVTGSIEFVGSGPVTWSGLRYGLFRHDSVGTVQYAKTDSARWGTISSGAFTWGKENYAYGYMFTPHSGTNDQTSWGVGGVSTQGVCNGGTWLSTYGATFPLGAVVDQAPARANFDAGKYDFMIAVQPMADGSNQVSAYMVKEGNPVTYWYGGTFKDTSHVSTTFNGIVFGLDPNYDQTNSPISAMTLTNVKVDLGTPPPIPPAPWENYYISDWGFYQGQMGGWLFTPDIVGNASMSGTNPNTGWAMLRGGFASATSPRNGVDSALVINGDLELDGGGFQSAGSLRFGLFYNDNPGKVKVISDTISGVVYDSTQWTGSNAHESGYLFIPTSGSNNPINWGSTPGIWGSVLNGAWDSTNTGYVLGSNLQTPANAAGTAGMYSFSISVAPAGSGTQIIAYQLKKSDNSYMIQGIATDSHSPLPTTKFNGIVFGLGTGNTTTALKLTNVQVTLGKPLVITGIEQNGDGLIPTRYELSQNYPNPFNPSTTINFALPKSGSVTLKVYDILGRLVTTLISSDMKAGYHNINFNATNLASGVYFYELKAGDFVSVKKLMLLK